MSQDLILSRLNLQAVLPNLETLIENDAKAAEMTRGWNACIQFTVKKGPSAYVCFTDGRCKVGAGKAPQSDILLLFFSCRHLNRMFDNEAMPIPLKGFTRLSFLSKQFPRLTDRLEYFLKPTDELLSDNEYARINTLLSLYTAGRAVSILSEEDKICKTIASGMPDGATIMMKILPDGPAVTLLANDGSISMIPEEHESPTAALLINDTKTANRLLNQKLDPFAAIALGEIKIMGQIPQIDAVDLILDRIPIYLKQ